MAKNKKVVSVDTNIMLRLLLNDVPEQTKKAEGLVAGHICQVADLALTETVFVLEKIYNMSREDVAANIYTIIRNPHFNCNRAIFEKVLPIYEANTSVSINDCLLATYADKTKALPLYTFDKKLTIAYPNCTKLL